MIFKRRKKRKDRFVSKYASIDFSKMREEEFKAMSKKIYSDILWRGILGIFLFISCVVLLFVLF